MPRSFSIYARGDYHKCCAIGLQKLATRIEQTAGNFRYRVCTDSAPVFRDRTRAPRRPGLARQNTHCCSHATAGSMFFVGEILTDLPLPLDAPWTITAEPASAASTYARREPFTAPYQLDARRCISY